MFLVIAYLLRASAQGLVYGQLHRGRDGVGIHDYLTVHVSCGSSSGLRQTPVITQESLLVGIEDSHQRHFWQVKTLTQQVYTHQHIVDPLTQVVECLHTVEGGHITMNIGGTDAVIQEVFTQFLGKALGDGRHQHPFAPFLADENLFHQVVDLVLTLTHLNLWVEQARRTNHLFHNDTLSFLQLEVGWCGTHVDHLVHLLLKLLKPQRTVVEGCWQTETIFHKVLLSATVTAIHRVQLRHRHMTLVDEQQIVVGEEVK